MKLEIKEVGSKKYYDEFLFILSNYKKMNNDSNTKIHAVSQSAYLYSAISLGMMIIFLVLYLLRINSFFIYIVGFFGFIFLFSLVYIYIIINKINSYRKIKAPSTFEINEESVSIKSQNSSYNLNWDEIKCIIIGKYTINFMPKDINKVFITTRIEYKENVLEALKKYSKDNLITK